MLKLCPGWELDVDRGPAWLLVRVHRPRQPMADAPPLSEVVWSLLEQDFIYRVVLELNELRRLDDRLIEQLIDLHDRIAAHGGLLRLCGLSPYNRRLLLERGLDDRFVPYEDREEAVMGDHLPRLPR